MKLPVFTLALLCSILYTSQAQTEDLEQDPREHLIVSKFYETLKQNFNFLLPCKNLELLKLVFILQLDFRPIVSVAIPKDR